MSIYYILTKDGSTYSLDSTSEVKVSYQSKVSDFPIEDGSVVSDHTQKQPTSISFTGIVSDIKAATNLDARTTEDFIQGLLNLRDRKEVFTLHIGSGGSAEQFSNFQAIDNCLFEALDITQDQQNGWAYGLNSYKVSWSAKQIILANKAKITSEPDPSFNKDATSTPTTGAGATTSLGNATDDTAEPPKESEVIAKQIDALLKGGE